VFLPRKAAFCGIFANKSISERVEFCHPFTKGLEMPAQAIPSLLTPGRIASELGVATPRVLYILATRPHISPSARAGTLRLFDRTAIAMVRHELNAIDARRATKEVDCAQ
jgi:hypothetical protein